MIDTSSFLVGLATGAIITMMVIYLATRCAMKEIKKVFDNILTLQKESSELLDKIEKAT